HGPRAPASQGTASRPPDPGSTLAAAVSRSSCRTPVSPDSHPRAAPAADTAAIAGRAPTGPGWGTDTLAVVPHDTIGATGVAPAPSTSQARSPAPSTT